MMRKNFRSEILKEYFNRAWTCLPAETRRALIHFIRQVREVDRLESARINCPDGSRICMLKSGEGFAFLYKDDKVAFCDILLAAGLVETKPSVAIGVILHDLAHAHDYLVAPEETVSLTEFEADLAAWDQAICWARAGIPYPELSTLVEFWGLYAEINILAAEMAEKKKQLYPESEKA